MNASRPEALLRGSTSEQSLVELARAGDDHAFELLLDAQLDRAYRTALAILRTDWDARDACQEVFLAAWRQLPSLRDPTRFRVWLDRIVVNECRSLLRRRRSRVREIALDDDTDSGRHSVAEMPAIEDIDIVRRAFARLSPDQRTILALHHAEQRPVKEIAAILAIPTGTVMWRLHSARRALERGLRDAAR